MFKHGYLVPEGVDLLVDSHLFSVVTFSCLQFNVEEFLFGLVQLLILVSDGLVESDYLCLYKLFLIVYFSDLHVPLLDLLLVKAQIDLDLAQLLVQQRKSLLPFLHFLLKITVLVPKTIELCVKFQVGFLAFIQDELELFLPSLDAIVFII